MDPYVVLLAGGSGTRLWPASRRERPKQFLAIAAERTMIAATRARVAPLVPAERTLVVAAEAHEGLVHEALPDLPRENLLLEPQGRNTLPAIALATAEIERRAPDSVQIVLPADHVISPEDAFRRTLTAAARTAAESGALVTLGAVPSGPATGYGYVEVGEQVGSPDGQPAHRVARFVEKPDRKRAEEYLATGRFLWNCGIFVWTTQAIVSALDEHAPRAWTALRSAAPGELDAVYAGLDPTSVDVAILERASARLVFPIDYLWSDVGSWASLTEVVEPDRDGNFVVAGTRLAAVDAAGNVVRADAGELVALIGVHDLVVVRAGGATLVCPRGRAEETRAIVELLERDGREWV